MHADWLNNISWYYAKLGRFERASLENVRKQELVQCICFRCWSPASLGSFASTGSGLALELLLSFGFGISSLASWWAINGSQWDSELKQQTIKFWLKPGAEDSLACGWVSQLFDWAISTLSWAAHTSWKTKCWSRSIKMQINIHVQEFFYQHTCKWKQDRNLDNKKGYDDIPWAQSNPGWAKSLV